MMVPDVMTIAFLIAYAAVTAAAGACARPNCLTNKNCPHRQKDGTDGYSV